MIDWFTVLGLVLTSALIATAGLAAALAFWRRQAPPVQGILACPTAGFVLILDGDRLVDATPAGRALLETGSEAGNDRFRALARLEALFPGLAARLDALEREGRIIVHGPAGPGPDAPSLCAEWLGGLTRLTMTGGGQPEAGGNHADEMLARTELAGLRDMLDHAPLPMWRCAADGSLLWANGAYLELAAQLAGPESALTWPLPDIFTIDGGDGRPDRPERPTRAGGPEAPVMPLRMLQLGAARRWYEVATASLGRDRVHFALPADRLHQAEEARNGTLQTLGQTFAQLPIGLAIFDRGRTLQIFNPVFGELAGISAETLAKRPTLAATLDAMRARATVPEPGDYRLWRHRITDMEKTASTGLFQEIWALPSGRTHRATIRPFPDGALAFMIEDITTELARSRQQRATSDLAHAVMDEIGDALIVFSRDGVVTMVNAAACKLWGSGLDAAGGRHGGLPAIALLRARTAPTLFWDDLSRYIGQFDTRRPREANLRMNDGRLVECRLAPLPQGSTLARFRLAPSPPASRAETEEEPSAPDPVATGTEPSAPGQTVLTA